MSGSLVGYAIYSHFYSTPREKNAVSTQKGHFNALET